MEPEKKLYTAEDIQGILGIGRTKAYEIIRDAYKKKGPFRVIRIGHLYRVHRESFENWINHTDYDLK